MERVSGSEGGRERDILESKREGERGRNNCPLFAAKNLNLFLNVRTMADLVTI